MLNTNQSKKRNSWGYYSVIMALATFVFFLFQMEVIAKEKPQITNENESNIKSVDVYKIRKNTTDAELSEIKNKLQKNHNVKFEISDLKRNDSNQLTSIIVDIKKGKQRAKSIQNSENHAINEFGVVIITYNNGDKKIGIQTVNDSHDKDSKTNTNSVVTNTAKKNTKLGNQLIIVDGQEMPSNFDCNSINAKDIESVSVFKGAEAISKYGDKGVNGVIEIETRK